MAYETFDTRFFIRAPAATIYAHLADPLNSVGLSPLITSVSDVQKGVDAEGRTVFHYCSNEQFHFLGFLTYNNHLRVTLTLARLNEQLFSDVDSPFNVKVRFTEDFQPDGDGTWITETISVQMPAPVRGYVVGEAKRVQVERTRILKERMEGA